MNISEFNGLAFNYKRYNCLHHVARVRRAAGLSMPNISTPEHRADVNELIEKCKQSPDFQQVKTPENFDIVVIMGPIGHVGIYVDGMISHCSAASRCVVLDRVDEFKNLEFYRVI